MYIKDNINSFKVKSIESKILAIIEISRALLQIHQQGITHRDIKPQNLYYYRKEHYSSTFILADKLSASLKPGDFIHVSVFSS